MGDSAEKLLAKLASLNDSLDDLEEKLEPLLAQTLPESLLPLETLQQVKLNVALPYLVYDLVFIFLKTRGIDPKTHPVVGELDRVRQYFDKIKNAEDPEKRKTAVDKAAANRFIKHAIAQVRDQRVPGPSGTHIRFDADGNPPSSQESQPTETRSSIPVRVTSKMLARQEYQRKLAEEQSEDDEEADKLQVFDEEGGMDDNGDEDEDVVEGEPKRLSSKAKGKARAVDASNSQVSASSEKKRRRAVADPFAGYGDDSDTKSATKAKKKKSAALDEENVSRTPATPMSSSTPSQVKKDKKAKKKAKKASALSG